ncbi:C-5 cytosine-specific DNA methylase [Pseudorhizobium banfieldiae]|uniref:DNA (cytosine-5-)-methyltransferase n=1 Tax=Pseudorhizobium banfieldiae TaxID=1125847 RepID=L0NFJ6_9HYPH|nr:DNA cytosine methyltransferase [Pseudorhizobium banfieldiae]CAD6605848.1 DNA methyltransferase [arsenite-oxidising bacterium NT-25]CCF19082.1 C-5 cytosine-specific DNA methylase [Pseudorhizobium banfieldiae]
MKKFLVADLLCGAGGSSTGAARAFRELGLQMELVCLNHWPVAIDTHQRNHPEARHYVQDIATVRPHLIVPEGYLDLLMASPTCTYHSVARGGKPTSDQQRSDPWHIITWLTELRVKRIIIENVWEFINWGPVDHRTGKPIKSRRGEYFHAWIETIKRLGFEPEWRKLNAADYGDATTRQRFILMARSDGRKVSWPMPTHKKRSEVSQDLFTDEKPWRPAADIIDWNRKGRSIYNRKKPLAAKTLARIHAGAVKYGWPEPFIVVLRNHMAAQGIDVPLPTITASGTHIGIAEPVVISPRHGKEGAGPRPRGVTQPLPTLTAGGSQVGVAEPVIVNMKGKSTASSSLEPLPTQTAHAAHLFSAEPIVLSQHNSGAPRSTEDPLPTITTGGASSEGRPGCARPMLVEPFILSQAAGGAPRGVSNPIPTQTTGGNGGAHALISPYYGSGSGETCISANEPLPTVTVKGRFGMVVPVTHTSGGPSARDVDTDPIPTLTTAKGGEFALVESADGELQYDILFRMLEPHELAAAMGFNDEESTYEFAGTKTQVIKQIGNAVSVAKMKACVGAIMADAVPPRAAQPAEFKEAAE